MAKNTVVGRNVYIKNLVTEKMAIFKKGYRKKNGQKKY